MGIYLNQPLKSRLGEEEWLDFFALVSSAFAHIEKQPLVPRFAGLSKEDTFRQVANEEKKLKVLEKLSGFAAAANIISKNRKNSFYHLIILNTKDRTIQLRSFAKLNFDAAQIAYAEAEKRAVDGEHIEPVLVAAGSIDSMKRAYPNFFLNTTEFIQKVREIITKVGK